jgi:hypothetical protein
MKLTCQDREFSFSEEIVQGSCVLRGRHEHFGCIQDFIKFNAYQKKKPLIPKKLCACNYLCVDPGLIPSIESILKDIFNEFEDIINEHTSLVPKPDCMDTEHEELLEPQRLFPELYKVVEYVVQCNIYFEVFYSRGGHLHYRSSEIGMAEREIP